MAEDSDETALVAFTVSGVPYRGDPAEFRKPATRHDVALALAHMRMLGTSVRAALALIPVPADLELRDEVRQALVNAHEQLGADIKRLMGVSETDQT